MIKCIELICFLTVLQFRGVRGELEEEAYAEGNSFSHQLTCENEIGTVLCLHLGGESQCGYMPNDIMWCDKGTLVNRESFCTTYNDDEKSFEVGECIYLDLPPFEIKNYENYTIINRLQAKCTKAFNRDGTLCSKCKDGYYPLAYSYDMTCVECPNGKNNWWKYIFAAFLPMTVFCFNILFFTINATSSHLHGFIFFTQFAFIPLIIQDTLINLYGQSSLLIAGYFITTLYGIWNLDFFRSLPFSICLEIGTLPNLALDLAVGVYPLLFMLVSYLMINLYDCKFTPLVIMWKPFNAVLGVFLRNVDIRTSLINSFATFFLLSSMKLLSATFGLLAPVRVYQVPLSDPFNVTVSWRLYYNATVHYLDKTHLPYAVLALVALVMVLIPMLMMSLYPFYWFQKLLNILPIHWHILNTYVDAFLGCYKDGTEPGTRDYRWFAALFLLIRPLLFLIGAFTLSLAYYIYGTMLVAIFIIAYINVEPFKDKGKHSANTINIMFLILLAIIYTCPIGFFSADYHYNIVYPLYGFLFVTVLSITLIYISCVTIHWIFSHRMFGLEPIHQLCAWRRGYKIME